jgi:hypothetical protein
MTLSIVALIIALCSLIWNIASTTYTWVIGKPHIRIDISSHETGTPAGPWLTIIIRNTGGSAVGMRSVSIWWQYGWRSRIGSMIDSEPDEKYGAIGPSLPYTLDAHHAQTWQFDAVRYLGQKNRSQSFPKRLLVEVDLATGRRITSKRSIGFFDRNRIDQLYESRSPEERLTKITRRSIERFFFRAVTRTSDFTFYEETIAEEPLSGPEYDPNAAQHRDGAASG